jgi:hypothetical protein
MKSINQLSIDINPACVGSKPLSLFQAKISCRAALAKATPRTNERAHFSLARASREEIFVPPFGETFTFSLQKTT